MSKLAWMIFSTRKSSQLCRISYVCARLSLPIRTGKYLGSSIFWRIFNCGLSCCSFQKDSSLRIGLSVTRLSSCASAILPRKTVRLWRPSGFRIPAQVYAQVPLHLELRPLVEKHKQQRIALEDLLEDITEIQITDMRRTYETVEALHARLLDYVLEANIQLDDTALESGTCESEIRAAFESIYSQASCLFWMDLPKDDKLQQVPEMAIVAIGIRAFNKYRGKGGDSFRCPFQSYTEYCNDLGGRVSGCLSETDEKIQRCTEAICQHIEAVGMRNVVIQRLRDELAYYLEAFALLESLESFLGERFEIVAGYSSKCAEHMQELHELAGIRKCVANELVLPSLQALGTLITSAYEELKLIESYGKALAPFLELISKPRFQCTPAGIADLGTSTGFEKLKVLVKYTTMLDPEICYVEWHENDLILNDDAEPRTAERCTIYCPEGALRVLEEDGALVQFAGYCPVALARHRGLLLFGNADIGLVKFEGLFYAFCNEEALKQFASKPELYLEAVENVIRKMPQLVHILGLETLEPYSIVNVSGLVDTLKEPIPCDFSGQTCIRQTSKSSLFYTTEALRRRLFNKRTDGTQTNSSYYRRSSYAQVWLPKENWTQTRNHRGSDATVRRVRNLVLHSTYEL